MERRGKARTALVYRTVKDSCWVGTGGCAIILDKVERCLWDWLVEGISGQGGEEQEKVPERFSEGQFKEVQSVQTIGKKSIKKGMIVFNEYDLSRPKSYFDWFLIHFL